MLFRSAGLYEKRNSISLQPLNLSCLTHLSTHTHTHTLAFPLTIKGTIQVTIFSNINSIRMQRDKLTFKCKYKCTHPLWPLCINHDHPGARSRPPDTAPLPWSSQNLADPTPLAIRKLPSTASTCHPFCGGISLYGPSWQSSLL